MNALHTALSYKAKGLEEKSCQNQKEQKTACQLSLAVLRELHITKKFTTEVVTAKKSLLKLSLNKC